MACWFLAQLPDKTGSELIFLAEEQVRFWLRFINSMKSPVTFATSLVSYKPDENGGGGGDEGGCSP